MKPYYVYNWKTGRWVLTKLTVSIENEELATAGFVLH